MWFVGEGLADVLEEGSYPRLKRLDVDRTGLSVEGADRLLGVIERGACPMLHTIYVNEWVDEGWEKRLEARGVRLQR